MRWLVLFVSFAVAFASLPIGSCCACSCAERPDSSYVRLVLPPGVTSDGFTLTISPSGGGETLASMGATIEVVLRNLNGAPCPGEPPQEIVLYHPSLCICPGGSIADAHTDATGRTTFTGTILGGGCAEFLNLYVSGSYLGRVPLRVNSPDSNANCFVDGSDLPNLARVLGRPEEYTFCLDFNDNRSIDASDVAYFAHFLGASCR